tara:strand:+ start:70 stop:558 length:489 start_codon:yes stop_codon:yes gene_type:complete
MAHFAELESKTDPTGFTSDTHLVVKRVVVVGNDVVPSDEHVDGETWCINFFGGGTWKQTSYNNNFRKQYAGIGYVYNTSKNKFLLPQPYASWSLNSSDDWKAPITYPSVIDDGEEDPDWIYRIYWDEDAYQANNSKGWKATKSNDTAETPTVYDWNGSTWVS